MSTNNYPIYDFKVTTINPSTLGYTTLPAIEHTHYPVVATSALDAWKDVVSHTHKVLGGSDLSEIQLIGVQDDGDPNGSHRPYFVEQAGVKFNPDLYFTPSTKVTTENLAHEVD